MNAVSGPYPTEDAKSFFMIQRGLLKKHLGWLVLSDWGEDKSFLRFMEWVSRY